MRGVFIWLERSRLAPFEPTMRQIRLLYDFFLVPNCQLPLCHNTKQEPGKLFCAYVAALVAIMATCHLNCDVRFPFGPARHWPKQAHFRSLVLQKVFGN